MKPRNSSFLTGVVADWTDNEFNQNFLVIRTTYTILCRVAICLWRLGTNVEYRTISHLFGVGVSTVYVVLHKLCSSVVNDMTAKYIQIPAEEHLRRIINGFLTKWDFPQCIGAIDGSHIPNIAPKEHSLEYFNRKGYHSVLLRVLIDHEYRFLDIYVCWPGSVQDARILANSTSYRKCESGNFLPKWDRKLGNTNVPLVIRGDPDYPLMPWLMKPFSDTSLTNKQRTFNYQLSRSQVVVENAFGRLKGRWRSLMKRNDCDVKYVPNLVTACCVLHNLCEMHGDRC